MLDEIERLTLLGLPPETLEIARRYYSQEERDAMDEEDFAGPNKTYPIKTQEDVHSAATLVGHAEDPEAVKEKIIAIAKRKGFSLPDAWQEDKPMNKTDQPDILRNLPSEVQLFLPIQRIDRDRREIVARATSESLDGYKTVFRYEGSKDAFSRWKGNIREMHDPTKAVGRAVKVEPLDDQKAIDLILRVSRGAEDTWQKVLDGTLSGLSVGAKNGQWGRASINGQEVPVLERYDLVEVSLVDNPANPDCTIQIVRADGVIEQDYLDESEEQTETVPPTPEERNEQPEETRSGARLSSDTRVAMHGARDHMLMGARKQMQACGCNECNGAAQALDADLDGDVDIIPGLDTDGDGGAAGDGSGDAQSRALREQIAEIIEQEIARLTKPLLQRLSGVAAQLAQVDRSAIAPDIVRRLDAVDGLKTELTEVRSLMSEVKGLVVAIATQPQQAQPIVNPALVRPQQPFLPQPSRQADPLLDASTPRHRETQVNDVVALLTGNRR